MQHNIAMINIYINIKIKAPSVTFPVTKTSLTEYMYYLIMFKALLGFKIYSALHTLSEQAAAALIHSGD